MSGLPHPRITRRIDLSASTTHSPPKDFDPSSDRPKVEKDRLPQPGSSQASTSAPPAVDMDAPLARDTFGEGGRPTSNLSQLARLFTSPERPLASGSAIDSHAGPSRPRPYVLSASPPPPPMEDGAEEEDEFMGISEPDFEEMDGVGAIDMDMEVDELDELQHESARIVGAIDRRASKVDPRRAQLAELANRRKRRILDSDSEPDPYPDDDLPNLIDLSREDDHPPSDNTKSARSGPRSSRSSGGTAAWSDTPESHMPVTPHGDDYNDEEDETPIDWPTSPALRGRGGGDDELARLFSSPPPPPPPGPLASASTSTSMSKAKAKGKGKQAQAPSPAMVVELLSDDDYVPVAVSPPSKSSSTAQKRKRSSPKKASRPRASTSKVAPTSSGTSTNGPRKSKSIQDYIDDLADIAGSGSPDRPSRSRSDDVPQEVEEEDEYDLDPFPFPFPSSFSGLGFDVPAVGPAATKVVNDSDCLLLIPDLPEDEQDFYMNHWRRGSNKKYPANDVVSMEELEEMADKSDARRANGAAAGRGRGAWGKRGAFVKRGAGRGRGRGRARGRAR